MKFMKRIAENIIIRNLPTNIKYLARDERGELWALRYEPMVKRDDKGRFMVFGGDNANSINDTYSLAVFNHLFNDIKPFTIMELE